MIEEVKNTIVALDILGIPKKIEELENKPTTFQSRSGHGGGSNNPDGYIPQLDSDPASPTSETAWVLKTGGATGGGLLQAITGLGFPILSVGVGSATYQFSYRTLEGTTKRVDLT